MLKLKIALSAVSIGFAANVAHAKESAPITFSRDGVTYVYTVEQVGKRRILRGVASDSNAPFTLSVGKTWVDGTANGSAVSFSLLSVRRNRSKTPEERLAQR